jgi:hypothetical protein
VLGRVKSVLGGSYSVTDVDDLSVKTGEHALWVSVRGSESSAESLLSEVTIMASPYVLAASPPFDTPMVMVYSSTGKEILGVGVMRRDIEAWWSDSITAEDFISRWILMKP